MHLPQENNQSSLAQLEYEELETLITGQGWSKTHALDLFRQIQRYGHTHEALFPDSPFPKKMRSWLKGQTLWNPFEWQVHTSSDGSVKYVGVLADGNRIETLLMPTDDRDTICLSSQVGCAMACSFCATGTMGLKRHLRAEEILHQVRMVIRDQAVPAGRQRRMNLHFMGMGEPLHNYDQVMKAFRILTDSRGLGFPQMDIGLSTCGYLPGIKKLATETRRPALMLSIGSPETTTRNQLMPVNKAWPLAEVIEFLRTYPLRKRERIMLSYVLIQGQNDQIEDAEKLLELARNLNCLINLIPMNEHGSSAGMLEPEEDHIQFFSRHLIERGAFCTIRRSRGRDIQGACGQFVQEMKR